MGGTLHIPFMSFEKCTIGEKYYGNSLSFYQVDSDLDKIPVDEDVTEA